MLIRSIDKRNESDSFFSNALLDIIKYFLEKYLIKIKKEISCLAEKTNKLLNKRPKSKEDKVQVIARKDKESLNKSIKLKSLNKDQVVVRVTK
jgi:hypothetical protein